MPKAYVILTETIHDQDGMRAYEAASGPPLIAHGGRLLSVDAAPVVLEGEWVCTRTVMVEFESMEAAMGWYESEDYRAALPLRQAAADSNVVILSGYTPRR